LSLGYQFGDQSKPTVEVRPKLEEDIGEYRITVFYSEIGTLEQYNLMRTLTITISPDTADDADFSKEFKQEASKEEEVEGFNNQLEA
jgi:hypothetical protein